MPIDATLLVGDGSGKLVDVNQATNAAGQTVYQEKAILIGEPADLLQKMYRLQQLQYNVLRAILATLQQSAPVFGIVAPNVVSETDFDLECGSNNE